MTILERKSNRLKKRIDSISNLNGIYQNTIEMNEKKISAIKKTLREIKNGSYEPTFIERFLMKIFGEKIEKPIEKPVVTKKKSNSKSTEAKKKIVRSSRKTNA